MSISDAVDEKYRIHTADLGSRAQRLVISNISYQGVEEMRPVLHFEGLTKRLVLTQQQSFDMIRLTRSSIPTDWIGETVILKPVRIASETTIEIHGPWAKAPRFLLASRNIVAGTVNQAVHRALQAVIAALFLAVLAAVVWLAAQNADALRTLLQTWLSS